MRCIDSIGNDVARAYGGVCTYRNGDAVYMAYFLERGDTTYAELSSRTIVFGGITDGIC